MPKMKVERVDGSTVRFDTTFEVRRAGRNVSTNEAPSENLGLTNQSMGARAGASFNREGGSFTLTTLAPDVAAGLPSSAPDLSRNPYNFAAWHGDGPWTEEAPEFATHDKEHEKGLSGRITLTYTSVTPVIVPTASSAKEVQQPWEGRHPSGVDRYGIPGSSMKGAVRVLFEALVNARLGVVDDKLKHPPLYRRRSALAYEVVEGPAENGAWKVQPVKWLVFLRGHAPCVGSVRRVVDCSNPKKPTSTENPPRVGDDYDFEKLSGGRETFHGPVEFRADLMWLPANDHTHSSKRVDWKVAANQTRNLPKDCVDRWRQMMGHPHLRANSGWTQDRENQLYALKVGDLIFGFDNGRDITAFGRNVNFLWPAPHSPKMKLGGFDARPEDQQQLAGADHAELTFGFAGSYKGGSHPFRGRVRFSTFWAEGQPTPMKAIRPMPLVSPDGVRAKSQPLYLKPRPGTKPPRSASYNDADAALRGRKLYWHQRQAARDIPLVHDEDALCKDNAAPRPQEEQRSRPVKPLPAGTSFSGTLDYVNLTEAELGALLVALAPHLAFGRDGEVQPTQGIKVGKGKPRGLGSLVATRVTVQERKPARQRYASLEAFEKVEKTAADLVKAYMKWAGQRAGGANWKDLEFAKDLDRLLRIPDESIRYYPLRFRDYNWLPAFNNPDGEPDNSGSRPPAMPLARDDEG